ncbi:MAG TPA: hypothetical protein VKB80_17535, partial [Kofleriaceae bacterium]|nr:hypothetical protein [Kofleriaceae bacterium]
MRSIVIAAVAGVGLAGVGIPLVTSCGGAAPPPPRGVIENDIDAWSFRRYQSLLDVEVWVSDNRAVAHTASYARKDAEKRGRLTEKDVVVAFVTSYQRDEGIEPAVVQFVRRLASESGYRVSEHEVKGVRLVEIRGTNEIWAMWPSRSHVVKIGGVGRDSIPDSFIGAYGERYPSRLHAGALDAPLAPLPA